MPRVRNPVGFHLLRRRHGRDVDLVDLGHVAHAVEPEHVVDLLLQLLEREGLGLDLAPELLDLAGVGGGRLLLGGERARSHDGEAEGTARDHRREAHGGSPCQCDLGADRKWRSAKSRYCSQS